ncbi:hypothetical protein [Herbinix luporum]|jgi:hypothetical protein|uniref:Uncharacterized protein n=1 Tax=Herbinix luporum TaxID=1679721 RepID=A0A0K8J6E1_9FIRM|nr:hypothetical protein [Herbinix luporum]CUH92959.1 hypothetical protein SD1D_1413 [Herbinix luporum]
MNIKKRISIIYGSIILGTAFLFCSCSSKSTVKKDDNIENVESEIISDEADKSEATDNIAPEHVYSQDELLAANFQMKYQLS